MTHQVLCNATLADGRIVDVTIADSSIAAVDAAGKAVATANAEHANAEQANAERVDLTGYVLLGAPVETHAHLDKAFLAEIVANPAGDLPGAIEAMQAHRGVLTVAGTIERAERAARLMAANGYVAVRTHVDVVIGGGLTSVEALVEVRRRVADVIDVEIVALCGTPAAAPDQAALLTAALDVGADLVGGCPYLDGDIEATTAHLLAIAADYGVGVDFHTDETLDPSANGLDVLARQVLGGFQGPATASHCVSLGQQQPAVQRATADRVAAAGIGVIALPQTNLYLQGRATSPVPRALTGLTALHAAGALVAAGADNLQDPFHPLGRADPFEVAGLMVIAGHLGIDHAWSTVTSEAAAVLGRAARGVDPIAPGRPADLLAIEAPNLRAAIAFGPANRIRWRAGERSGTPV